MIILWYLLINLLIRYHKDMLDAPTPSLWKLSKSTDQAVNMATTHESGQSVNHVVAPGETKYIEVIIDKTPIHWLIRSLS